MGDIFLSAAAIIFCLLAGCILYCFIKHDIDSARAYRNALVVPGRILSKLNDADVYQYGGLSFNGRLSSSVKKYFQFEVAYQIQGESYVGKLVTRKKKLRTGESVELHCAKSPETGEWEVLSPAGRDRLRQLVFVAIAAVILSVFIMWAQTNGMI